MKVYSDFKGPFILIRSKVFLDAAGFTEGKFYSVTPEKGKLILTLRDEDE